MLPAPFSFPWLEVFQVHLPDDTAPGVYRLAVAIVPEGEPLSQSMIKYKEFEVVPWRD